MTKLSEIQNEEALDLLADIIEPMTMILGDGEVAKIYQSDEPKLKLVSYIIKNHKAEIIEIMAHLDGVPVEEYHCNVFSLPMKLIELLNDKELISFFTSTAQSVQTSFGDAMVNTEAGEK